MSEPVIKLTDVCFAFTPDQPVLSGIGLALHRAERIALTGPIGCGKTTLLRLIVGLIKPVSGTIHAFGSDRVKERDFHEVRRRAGLVFQRADDQLFCPTVIEDISFGPLNLGKSPAEARVVAEETLEQLGLEGFSDRITYRLSGGEKRLVSLASVLAMKPDVLLLDEPTAGLDEVARAKLSAVLDELEQAMIIVSHERSFVSSLSARCRQMKDGTLSIET